MSWASMGLFSFFVVNLIAIGTANQATASQSEDRTAICRTLLNEDTYRNTDNEQLRSLLVTLEKHDLQTEPTEKSIRKCFARMFTSEDSSKCRKIRRYNLSKSIYDDLVRIKADLSPGSGEGETWEENRYNGYLWLRHPDFAHLCDRVSREDITVATEGEHKEDLYLFILSGLFIPDPPGNVARSWIGARFLPRAISKNWATGLRKAMDQVCSLNLSVPFCYLFEIARIANYYNQFREEYIANPSLRSDADKFNLLAHSIMSNHVVLRRSNPVRYNSLRPILEEDQDQILKDVNDALFDGVSKGNVTELQYLLRYLPDVALIEGCHDTLADGEVPPSHCLLKLLLDQANQYVELSKAEKGRSEVSRKIIYADVDYKKLLEERRTERILNLAQGTTYSLLTVTEHLTLEYQKDSSQRFQDLKRYFIQLQSFNEKKVYSDIAYLNGRLNGYQAILSGAVTRVSNKLGRILDVALKSAICEVVQKGIRMMVTIASNMNPLKVLFSSGGAVDIMDAIDEFTKALNQLAGAAALQEAWMSLLGIMRSLTDKFNQNGVFLRAVKDLVDDAREESSEEFERSKILFLEKYNDYDPKVYKTDLAEGQAGFEAVADAGCGLLNDFTSSCASAVQIADSIINDNVCVNVQSDIAVLFEAYNEIYDFQFELIETLASYMRAKTAINAANDMNKDFEQIQSADPENEEVIETLRYVASVSYSTYKIQTWQTVESYCDVLEYKEGGTRPSQCKGPLTDLSLLLARFDKPCTEFTDVVDIPTEPETDDIDDLAFLNITRLFSGDWVTFKIPDIDWLEEHDWLTSNGTFNATFIKQFGIFLPKVTEGQRRVQVEYTVASNNTLSAEGIHFIISPPRKNAFSYREGNGYHACRKASVLNNPYPRSDQEPAPDICILTTLGDSCSAHGINYSVLAALKVRVLGYSSSDVPSNIESIRSLKAIVTLCQV